MRFNMDKTRLFFSVIPLYNVMMSHEDLFIVPGKKEAKNMMISVVLCNNSETKWIPITMIEKSKMLVCIAGNTWYITYFHQKNAWINVVTFNKWFNDIFEPNACRRIWHKVLLLLNNARGHSNAFECNDICIEVFSFNVTSWK